MTKILLKLLNTFRWQHFSLGARLQRCQGIIFRPFGLLLIKAPRPPSWTFLTKVVTEGVSRFTKVENLSSSAVRDDQQAGRILDAVLLRVAGLGRDFE